jgi:enoyl-CoA hydratase/carnithine racemase
MYIATQRLYVNRDYSKIVPENSPEAAFLLATPGKPIDTALARRLGLLDKPKPKPEPEPEAKMVAGPPANKAVTQRQTKARAEPAGASIVERHPFPSADDDEDEAAAK